MRGLFIAVSLVSTVLLNACPPTETADSGPGQACVPGATQTCVCAGGAGGGQKCNSSGTAWENCQCSALPDAALPDTRVLTDASRPDGGHDGAVPDAAAPDARASDVVRADNATADTTSTDVGHIDILADTRSNDAGLSDTATGDAASGDGAQSDATGVDQRVGDAGNGLAPISNFAAVPSVIANDHAIQLTWHNSGGAFAGVIILRRADGTTPTNPADTFATVVYDGAGEAQRDGSGIDDGVEYRYRAWAYDLIGNYALPVLATARRMVDDDTDSFSEDQNDCDDNNQAMSPLAFETVGDEIDSNCDGQEDCFLDNDDDGYRPIVDNIIHSADVDCRDPREARASDPSTDCSDDDGNSHPGATEVADDGIDQNCDGKELCYLDNDNDGYRPDLSATIISDDIDCTDTREARATDLPGDCNDNDAGVHPGAASFDCSATDWDCDTDLYEDDWCLANVPPTLDETNCVVNTNYTCDQGRGCNWNMVPDYDPCLVSGGSCLAGVCYAVGSCEQAICNVAGPHFTLADTNQRQCFDNATIMTCPSTGQDFFGQDAQYGWDTSHAAADRFTRNTTVAAEPVVQDNVTGLIWQGCTAGLHGAGCATGTVETKTWQEARNYCTGLTWGGHDDWYLPDEYELQSIVDFGRYSPAIDDTAFPATASYWFWSSSSSYTGSGWFVGFGSGAVASFGKDNASHVRCVRPGPGSARVLVRSTPVADEPVVQDSATGLLWQGCTAGLGGSDCATGSAETRTWQQALAYCAGLAWGGRGDWRLPDIKELRSIVDNRRLSPTIDATAFPATPSDWFWSSSSFALSSDVAWGVGFGGGNAFNDVGKDYAGHVRCVRPGP